MVSVGKPIESNFVKSISPQKRPVVSVFKKVRLSFDRLILDLFIVE